MHIWDGQQDAPNRDRYKAYVALCDKDWASRGDTLVSTQHPVASIVFNAGCIAHLYV